MPDFAPCPTCKQFSHSIPDDELGQAFRYFEAMICGNPLKSYPTHHAFTEETRRYVQVLVAAARNSGLEEARKRLEAEVVLNRLVKAVRLEPGYHLATIVAEADQVLEAVNDPPAVAGPDGEAALTAAVEAYDEARCRENNRHHGGNCQRMSDANRDTIRPMIAAAVGAYVFTAAPQMLPALVAVIRAEVAATIQRGRRPL